MQSPPCENQNEITSGRSKKSQTRIAPGVGDPAGGRAPGDFGAGRLRGLAVVLGDVGVAFQRTGGTGTANSGSGQRLGDLVETERAFVLVPERVDHGDHDHRGEDQPDDERVAIPHGSSSQTSAAGSATITPEQRHGEVDHGDEAEVPQHPARRWRSAPRSRRSPSPPRRGRPGRCARRPRGSPRATVKAAAPLLAEAGREDDAELVAIAIVSAPSAADIGLSGIWLSQSTSDDQPVASTTGTSGTSARLNER